MNPSNLAVELAADNVSALDGASVTPIKASIGSRISGYRFDGKSISDDFRAAMRHLLHNRGLVVFEPGTVTAENFTKFGGFLGEFFHYAGPQAKVSGSLDIGSFPLRSSRDRAGTIISYP